MLQKICALTLIGSLAFSTPPFLWEDSNNASPEQPPALSAPIHSSDPVNEKPTHRQTTTARGVQLDNFVAGYSILYPHNTRLSFDDRMLCARITFDDGSVFKIMKTTRLPSYTSSTYYVSLSSGQEKNAPSCFQNTHDHKILSQKNTHFYMYPATITEWDRRPLTKVKDDRPHYWAADMALGHGSAVTFQYNSAHPLTDARRTALIEMVASYRNSQPTVQVPKNTERNLARLPARWNSETRAYYTAHFSPKSPLSWGIFSPEYSNFKYDQLHRLESDLHTRFTSVVHYMDFKRSIPRVHVLPVLKQAHAEGRAVELTVQTNNPATGPNHVYDTLCGKNDAYLHDLAAVIKESGATVLLRVGNEMNGDWCAYSPVHLSRDADVYVAFYRYVIDRLVADGCGPQLIYVWNPNNESFPAYTWNNPHLCWPGNDYVDVVGLTGYNTGNYFGWEPWQSFDQLYKNTYDDFAAITNKPMMITEFACASKGGNKVQWTEDMLRKIDRDYPHIKMAIWWHHADYDPKNPQTVSRDYWINKPDAMVPLFRHYFDNHGTAKNG